eukprot:COSAG02_NODE_11402_length_1725_cov_7.009810_1_plen_240_part_10
MNSRIRTRSLSQDRDGPLRVLRILSENQEPNQPAEEPESTESLSGNLLQNSSDRPVDKRQADKALGPQGTREKLTPAPRGAGAGSSNGARWPRNSEGQSARVVGAEIRRQYTQSSKKGSGGREKTWGPQARSLSCVKLILSRTAERPKQSPLTPRTWVTHSCARAHPLSSGHRPVLHKNSQIWGIFPECLPRFFRFQHESDGNSHWNRVLFKNAVRLPPSALPAAFTPTPLSPGYQNSIC